MPVDPRQLDAHLAAIEKTYGAKSYTWGNDKPDIKRIPTGSYELDFITGGGIPLGRVSRFWGSFSSGKSLTAWNVVREAQKLGLTCAYYNIEKQYHEEFVRTRGIDTEKLLVLEGGIIEEVGDKLESLLASVHLHVVDSLSSGISQDELAAQVGDWQIGLRARAWGKVFARALARLDDYENAIIMIDQARDVFGAKGGEHPPNGRFVEHTSSMTLYFKQGSWLWYDDRGVLSSKGDKHDSPMSQVLEPDGMEMQVRVNKSRVCRPYRAAKLKIGFDDITFDTVDELARAGKWLKVFDTGGSGSYTLSDGTKIRGMSALRQRLTEDEGLRLEIAGALQAAW